MEATIDKAGRLVIPKRLRDELGLVPGSVKVTADGAALRVEPLHQDDLYDEGERLVIPRSGSPVDDELVTRLRDADRT